LISFAIWLSDGAKVSSQIDITRPLSPNWSTNWAMRTAGSALLVSAAVHECEIFDQGQEAAPHDVSAMVGWGSQYTT